MNIFKWTKNNKLYFIWYGEKKIIALPVESSYDPIFNPDLTEFVPAKSKKTNI